MLIRRVTTPVFSGSNCAFKEGHGFDLQAGLPIMLTTLGAFVPRMRAEPQEELTRKAKSELRPLTPI
ncbi:MAG: hypothetical protein DMG72_23590 [Acidobacteria bacterium]|nr:MAG: hypothetical protein DMG72_23590 [Acidobacteriota bacterium]